jgi:hypothetical protein
MNMIQFDPYFTINGVGITSKAYSKENNTMYFYTQDGKLQASFSQCTENYSWSKCRKLFGD